MSNFLLEHLPGCTPLKPCKNCEAATLLRQKLSPAELQQLAEKIGALSPQTTVPTDPRLTKLLATRIEDAEPKISVRLCNALLPAGGFQDGRFGGDIKTLGDLVKWTENNLRRLPNIGEISIREIKQMLESNGLKLAGSQ